MASAKKDKQFFVKIFQVEKKMAYAIIDLMHDNIMLENKKIKSFIEDTQIFLSSLTEIIPIHDNSIPRIMRVFEARFSDFLNTAQRKHIDNFIYEQGKNTSEKIYNLMENFLFQLGLEVEKKKLQEQDFENLKLFKVDKTRIEKYIKTKAWGGTIESRVKNIKKETIKKIKKELTEGMKEGLAYKKIIANCKKKIAQEAVRVEKIIRTEGQRVQNNILMKTYHENKQYLAGIEYTATLDTRTCTVCGAWDRTQFWFEPGKGRASVYDAPYVPQHPLCRCVYIPISKLWELLGKSYQRTRASEHGPTTGTYGDFLRKLNEENPEKVKGILGKHYKLWKEKNFNVTPRALKLIPQQTYEKYLGTGKKKRKKKSEKEKSESQREKNKRIRQEWKKKLKQEEEERKKKEIEYLKNEYGELGLKYKKGIHADLKISTKHREEILDYLNKKFPKVNFEIKPGTSYKMVIRSIKDLEQMHNDFKELSVFFSDLNIDFVTDFTLYTGEENSNVLGIIKYKKIFGGNRNVLEIKKLSYKGIESTINHEFGHHVFFTFFETEGKIDKTFLDFVNLFFEFEDWEKELTGANGLEQTVRSEVYQTKTKIKNVDFPTEYAQSNAHEIGAECFEMYVRDKQLLLKKIGKTGFNAFKKALKRAKEIKEKIK